MSTIRIALIVVGVVAVVWLLVAFHGFLRPACVSAVAPTDTRGDARVTRAAALQLSDQNSAAREVDTVPADARPVFDREATDGAETWRRSLDECATASPRDMHVCKYRFEPRDPKWAPEAERAILDFVADAALFRPSDEFGPPLECRVTVCRFALTVDRPSLADQLRSAGRYDESAAREHEFAYLTLGSRWAYDRAEELRLTLVSSGLFEADSVAEVGVGEPVDREESSFLLFELSRCRTDQVFCPP
jgi:hypothetical protein